MPANFDLEKMIGLPGGSFGVTLVGRWGRDLAADASIPDLQLLNEVSGRGNIVRTEEFAYSESCSTTGSSLPSDVWRSATTFLFLLRFINLTFCGAPPGDIMGVCISFGGSASGRPSAS